MLDLRVRPGQLKGAGDGGDLAVVVGEGQGLVARVGHGGREGDDGRRPASIRTRRRMLTIGSSTAPVVPLSSGARVERRRRGVVRPRPRNRARSVSNCVGAAEFGRTRDGLSVRRHVDRPDRRLVGRAGAAAAQDRLGGRRPLGFEEELAERRVAGVAAVVEEHDLGIAGQLELARAGVVVGQRDPADLGAGFGRDRDLGQALDLAVEAAERDLVGREDCLVVVRRRHVGWCVADQTALLATSRM